MEEQKQKHIFKFRREYEEKHGKKMEQNTRVEVDDNEAKRSTNRYQNALHFYKTAHENIKEKNGNISDDYYKYLREEQLEFRDISKLVLEDHPEYEWTDMFIQQY